MQRERTSDQTFVGWDIEIEKVRVVGTLYKIGKGGDKGVPLSGIESAGMVSSRGVLRVSSISWILSFCPSTLFFSCLVRCIFAPLLRLRSISCVTLESLGEKHTGRD